MPDSNASPDEPVKPDPKAPATSALREESAPRELTGRAAGTDDDLTALFRNDTQDHFADGFSGGSDDDTGVAIKNDGDLSPEEPGGAPASE